MKVFFTVTSLLVFLYWQDRTGGEIRDTNVGSWGPVLLIYLDGKLQVEHLIRPTLYLLLQVARVLHDD